MDEKIDCSLIFRYDSAVSLKANLAPPSDNKILIPAKIFYISFLVICTKTEVKMTKLYFLFYRFNMKMIRTSLI